MNDKLLATYDAQLEQLKQQNNHRHFRQIAHQGQHIILPDGKKLLNLASNDYLGVAGNADWQQEFLATWQADLPFGSSSSRLLTGNFESFERLEWRLSQAFGRSCLLFNSGYHANVGIIPAICDGRTVILADKLVHASMIDGIRLSPAKCVRYQHQDFVQLARLVARYQDDEMIDKIIIMTESIFSMDGDITDLPALVALKQSHDKVMLYVDEAHAIGTHGDGLGCAMAFGAAGQIDWLVGAFGKAIGSVGAFVICHQLMRDFLINKVRPLIFSTALPPINVAWTDFVFARLSTLDAPRQRLATLSAKLREHIGNLGLACPSSSHIVPIIVGQNERVLQLADELQQQGLFVLAVRPPTVPAGQARLRLCLNASIDDGEFAQLTNALMGIKI